MKNLFIFSIMLFMGVSVARAGVPANGAVDNGRSASYKKDAEQYLKKGDIKAAIIQLKNAKMPFWPSRKMLKTGLRWPIYILRPEMPLPPKKNICVRLNSAWKSQRSFSI